MQITAEQNGVMLQIAMEKQGWTLDGVPQEIAEAFVWQALAARLMTTDPNASMDELAGNFIADMTKIPGGGTASVDLIILNDSELFTEDAGDGVYYSRYYDAGEMLKIKTAGDTLQVGFVRTGIDQYEAYGWTTTKFFTLWYVNGQEVRSEVGLWDVSGAETIIDFYDFLGWRVYRRGHYHAFGGYTAEYRIEYSARYSVNGTPKTATIRFNLGTHRVSQPTIPLNFSYSAPTGGTASTIGDDVKSVTSIIGGNGADAVSPSSTRDFLGQGGNGGNGGGGAGAGGTCKQEIVHKFASLEVDRTQTIGEMTNGAPGLGTAGTPGHSGGAYIFW